jgi:hypothetical protein
MKIKIFKLKYNRGLIFMPKKKTTLIRSPDFKTIYAVGAIGTWTPYDFRINFYSEKVIEDLEESYVNDSQIILSPKATKEFALWLIQNVKDYEATYGKVRSTSDSVQNDEEDSLFISDIRTELKNDIKDELERDIKKFVANDFKEKLKKDMGEEIKSDLRKYFKQNLHDDLKKDLRVVPTPELKKDLKKVLKADLKQDLRKDIKKDLEREFKRTLPAGIGRPQKLKTKPKPHLEGVKKGTGSNVSTKAPKLNRKKK